MFCIHKSVSLSTMSKTANNKQSSNRYNGT